MDYQEANVITLKCNMCNANLIVEEGDRIVTCEFCGATQSLPEREGDNSARRGYMFLEEGRFSDAKDYFNKALDENAESSEAYLGRVLVALEIKSKEEFFDLNRLIELEPVLKNIKYSTDYKNAIRFAGVERKQQLEKYREDIYQKAYDRACKHMNEADYYEAISWFKWIEEYKNTAELLVKCECSLKNEERDDNYKKATEYMEKKAYNNAIGLFEKMPEYKDCMELVSECKYRMATDYKKSEEYMDAIGIFKEILDYKDSKQKMHACESVVKERRYLYAKEKLQKSTVRSEVEQAKSIFEELEGYKDSDRFMTECEKEITYMVSKEYMKKAHNAEMYKDAGEMFETIKDYKDASRYIRKCKFSAKIMKLFWLPIVLGIVIIIALVLVI